MRALLATPFFFLAALVWLLYRLMIFITRKIAGDELWEFYESGRE